MVGQAIFAGGRNDDGASFAHNLAGGAHPFNGLVQVLIQGIATVGGNHNVVRDVYPGHRTISDKITAGRMGKQHIAGKHARDLVLYIKGYVEQEGGVGQ